MISHNHQPRQNAPKLLHFFSWNPLKKRSLEVCDKIQLEQKNKHTENKLHPQTPLNDARFTFVWNFDGIFSEQFWCVRAPRNATMRPNSRTHARLTLNCVGVKLYFVWKCASKFSGARAAVHRPFSACKKKSRINLFTLGMFFLGVSASKFAPQGRLFANIYVCKCVCECVFSLLCFITHWLMVFVVCFLAQFFTHTRIRLKKEGGNAF